MTAEAKILELIADPPTWTAEDMRLEHDRQLAKAIASLGPRPRWWRRAARQTYDRKIGYLKMAFGSDLHVMLTAPDPKQRAIRALLLGWNQPTRSEEQS
jgi:hypothetical protein